MLLSRKSRGVGWTDVSICLRPTQHHFTPFCTHAEYNFSNGISMCLFHSQKQLFMLTLLSKTNKQINHQPLHTLLFIQCKFISILFRCEARCRNAGLIGISLPRQSLPSPPPSGTSFLDLPYPLRRRIYLLTGLVRFCPINFNQEGLNLYKYRGKHSLKKCLLLQGTEILWQGLWEGFHLQLLLHTTAHLIALCLSDHIR